MWRRMGVSGIPGEGWLDRCGRGLVYLGFMREGIIGVVMWGRIGAIWSLLVNVGWRGIGVYGVHGEGKGKDG